MPKLIPHRDLVSSHTHGWDTSVIHTTTYRVETFEFRSAGHFDSFLLQGGQRSQSIRLLTEGRVTFLSLGFRASVPFTNVDTLPGGFDRDHESLIEIWKIGARAVGLACVEKNSQHMMWEIDDQGAFVRGMRSGISAKGACFENYTLEFDA